MPARPGSVFLHVGQIRATKPTENQGCRVKAGKGCPARSTPCKRTGLAFKSEAGIRLSHHFSVQINPPFVFSPLKKKTNTTLFIFKLRGKASSSLGFPPSPCHCSLLLWMSTNSSQTALETRRRDELDQKRQEEGQCFAQYLGSTDQHRKKK